MEFSADPTKLETQQLLHPLVPTPYRVSSLLFKRQTNPFIATNGRLEGSTAFTNNSGGWGGAIFNAKAETDWYPEKKFRYKMPVITYPDDTVFSGNIANVRRNETPSTARYQPRRHQRIPAARPFRGLYS